MLNIVRLKKFDTNTVEWLTGLAGVFSTHPECWTYMPEPITNALAIQCGSTQSHTAITGLIQKGIDQSTRKIASSRSDLRRRLRRMVNSLQRCAVKRHGQCANRYS